MADYYTLLAKEAGKRNWNPNQINVFENWRNSVGQIESNNIPTRTQGDSPKGIGRGKYQYETSKGSATNKTATNRLKSFLKKNNFSIKDLPESDRKVLSKGDPDFSLLSEDTQDIIFLADKSEAPETKLNDLVSGAISPDEAWIKWHWKGPPKEAKKKREQWFRNLIVPEEEAAMQRRANGGGLFDFATGAGNVAKDAWDSMNTLQKVGVAPIPVVSDIAGLFGDVQMMYEQPEERTLTNAGFAALGALPFVPAGIGATAIKSVDDLVTNGLADVTKKGKFKHYTLKDNNTLKELDLEPEPEASGLTQITTTKGSYEKAIKQLDKDVGEGGRWLDFGAGKGYSGSRGAVTHEPYPDEDFIPDFKNPDDIPDDSFDKITSLNVLNAVSPSIRKDIVTNIGKKLAPNGQAIITTRGSDVLDANGILAAEPMSIITTRGTYQKGFKPDELKDYVEGLLGDNFEVIKMKSSGKDAIGKAGVKIRKRGQPIKEEFVDLNITGFESTVK